MSRLNVVNHSGPSGPPMCNIIVSYWALLLVRSPFPRGRHARGGCGYWFGHPSFSYGLTNRQLPIRVAFSAKSNTIMRVYHAADRRHTVQQLLRASGWAMILTYWSETKGQTPLS